MSQSKQTRLVKEKKKYPIVYRFGGEMHTTAFFFFWYEKKWLLKLWAECLDIPHQINSHLSFQSSVSI